MSKLKNLEAYFLLPDVYTVPQNPVQVLFVVPK